MSRDNLHPLVGQPVRWQAQVVRYGNNRATQKPTVLLEDLRAVYLVHGKIKLSCRIEHVWLDTGPWCEGVPLGSTIYLDAMVIPYRKGDTRTGLGEADYKLERPHNVVVAQEREKAI